MTRLRRRRRPHPAIVAVAITFLALLATAGLRSAPGVLMVPLQVHFGWDRATVSFTAATGILLYGLLGPFAAALMDSFGIRRTMIAGLSLMAFATLASQWMTQSWQFWLTWGVLSGIGSGAITSVLGAAVVNRWFARHQGVVMGLLTASTATGALVFLPVLAWLTQDGAWRPVVVIVGVVSAVLAALVAAFMPERPGADHGRFGEAQGPDTAPARAVASPLLALTVLRDAARLRVFWLLFGTFFVCGFTTNGLIGTHLIAYCGDRGIAPVVAAGLLTTMGVFDLIGTTASGWLTDRYDPRKLLVVYYTFRALSLLALPFVPFDAVSLGLFAVFYGLDWIATVPPTVAIANRVFGERIGPIAFGWILVGHQTGAAVAALGAGVVREIAGSYDLGFVASGVLALVAAIAAAAIPVQWRSATGDARPARS